uniref:Uncharacterized protein n=1 Tax=viral metagenome TaxID=1070528 RepID=A0A6C0JS62_9ZZZZ
MGYDYYELLYLRVWYTDPTGAEKSKTKGLGREGGYYDSEDDDNEEGLLPENKSKLLYTDNNWLIANQSLIKEYLDSISKMNLDISTVTKIERLSVFEER